MLRPKLLTTFQIDLFEEFFFVPTCRQQLPQQMQAQVSPCDSISYTITSSANTNILQLNGVITGVCPVTFPCVVSDWSWAVCDDALCFSDNGQTAYFQQFNS